MNKEQLRRLDAVNELIEVIASCGRQFFHCKGNVARMELDDRGRVWFYDAFTRKRIYTHYDREWKGFSNGGTLRSFIEFMRDHIKKGRTLSAGYFSEERDMSTWAYEDDRLIVLDAAVRLGIAK